MTDFEKELKQYIEEVVEEATWYDENDPEDEGSISDVALCDCMTSELPIQLLEKLQESGEFIDLEHDGFASACNVSIIDGKHIAGTCGQLPDYYEVDLTMNKDSEYIGDITIRLKYGTTEECDDIMQYKFVPKEVDCDTVEFKVFHG